MDINVFVKNFASQFYETEEALFSPETSFRDIDEWSSLLALSIIAMVDEEYNIAISGEDIRTSTTIKDLFDKVVSKS